jgi:hypothetical protein
MNVASGKGSKRNTKLGKRKKKPTYIDKYVFIKTVHKDKIISNNICNADNMY